MLKDTIKFTLTIKIVNGDRLTNRLIIRPHQMLRLADTSIRLYRKADETVSVRLRSYLMVHAKGRGFRLSAYLNRFDCSVKLATGQSVNLDDVMYTDDCWSAMDHMVHELWASGSTSMDVIKDSAALLRVEYRLFSFDGQGSPSVIETVVPVLARGRRALRYARASRSAA